MAEPDPLPVRDSAAQQDQLRARQRLRQELDQLDLDPGQTRDDFSSKQTQDRRLLEDVPPHHGS